MRDDEPTTIDWAALSHAYGAASDVPELLARLRSGDAAEAGQELWASVLHQGTLYDATPPAIAAICRVLAGRVAARSEIAGRLLAVAIESAHTGPADDPLASAVLAAAEPAWLWATKAITRAQQAAVAASVLRAYRSRAAQALPLLTDAVTRWPGRPEFLVAIHALDPDSPVLAGRLDAARQHRRGHVRVGGFAIIRGVRPFDPPPDDLAVAAPRPRALVPRVAVAMAFGHPGPVATTARDRLRIGAKGQDWSPGLLTWAAGLRFRSRTARPSAGPKDANAGRRTQSRPPLMGPNPNPC